MGSRGSLSRRMPQWEASKAKEAVSQVMPMMQSPLRTAFQFELGSAATTSRYPSTSTRSSFVCASKGGFRTVAPRIRSASCKIPSDESSRLILKACLVAEFSLFWIQDARQVLLILNANDEPTFLLWMYIIAQMMPRCVQKRGR